jgi:hypothetical protein
MRVPADPTWQQTGPGLAVGAPDHLRRNFGLGVVNGIAYNVYIALLGTEVVMAWFLSSLTDSNLLISLLIPIDLGSWYFLQLILSGYVQRQPRSLPLYQHMGVIRVAVLAVLALTAFTLDRPGVLLAIFFLAFTVNSIAAGVAALPFLNVVAKTIPPQRRGMYYGVRRFAGGLLGLLGGLLVKVILGPDFGLGFPRNYALLFSLGVMCTAVLVGSFSFVVEPAEVVNPLRIGLAKQLRRAAHLPFHDHNYACFLGLRVAIVLAGFSLPFYAVFARRVLGAPEDMVGIYLIGSTLAGVLSNLLLGQVADRYGNRLVMRLAALTLVLPSSMALLIIHLPPIGLAKDLLFVLVFVFQGLHITAYNIGGSNYLLDMAPSLERALYIGFAHGIVGAAIFASPLGGAIVDLLGFEPLFLFSLAFSLVAVVLSLLLDEPRRRQPIVN